MAGYNLRQKQMQQGEHLKKRCKLWAPTWQKEMGWVPGQVEMITPRDWHGRLLATLQFDEGAEVYPRR